LVEPKQLLVRWLSLRHPENKYEHTLLNYVDIAAGVTLWGPDSIVGRSIVIHKNVAQYGAVRWVCATLGTSRTASLKQHSYFTQ
jgi:hypothetical protein